jgi:hypothetical protein
MTKALIAFVAAIGIVILICPGGSLRRGRVRAATWKLSFRRNIGGGQGTGGLAGARSDKSGRPYCRSERSLGASGRGSENFQCGVLDMIRA